MNTFFFQKLSTKRTIIISTHNWIMFSFGHLINIDHVISYLPVTWNRQFTSNYFKNRNSSKENDEPFYISTDWRCRCWSKFAPQTFCGLLCISWSIPTYAFFCHFSLDFSKKIDTIATATLTRGFLLLKKASWTEKYLQTNCVYLIYNLCEEFQLHFRERNCKSCFSVRQGWYPWLQEP